MVTVAIVSTPFSFEMGRRQINAREGLAKLRPFVDTLITVPNDRLLQIAPRDLTLDLASAWRMTSCARCAGDHRTGDATWYD
jgi:cell division protein FtsZ